MYLVGDGYRAVVSNALITDIFTPNPILINLRFPASRAVNPLPTHTDKFTSCRMIAAPASVINACTQDCANFTLGAEFRKNSSHGARQGVGARESIFEGECVVRSYEMM